MAAILDETTALRADDDDVVDVVGVLGVLVVVLGADANDGTEEDEAEEREAEAINTKRSNRGDNNRDDESAKSSQPPSLPPPYAGYMTVTAGTIEGGGGDFDSGDRVVGIESHDIESDQTDENLIRLGDDVYLYRHSVAKIPDAVSYEDAVSTACASLVPVHVSAPREGGGGMGMGSAVMGAAMEMTGNVFGRVVVLGGSDSREGGGISIQEIGS